MTNLVGKMFKRYIRDWTALFVPLFASVFVMLLAVCAAAYGICIFFFFGVASVHRISIWLQLVHTHFLVGCYLLGLRCFLNKITCDPLICLAFFNK